MTTSPLAAVSPADVPPGLGPADLRSAYGLTSDGGAGVTVAVVAAYDMPYAEEDLAVYRSQFGLPPCTTANGCFRKVDQRGGTDYPEPDFGWGAEVNLDVQMVSAICPHCSILLVEADAPTIADLGQAVDTAALLGALVISNSYGGMESSTFSAAEGHWDHPGVAVLASSGDSGFGVSSPASSGHVIAVGGTSLTRSGNARGWTESAWIGSGSGCSTYMSKPDWQADPGCANRSVADVSAVADPETGVAMYDPDFGGWGIWGGTSASSPIVGAIFALANGPSGGGAYPASNLYAHAGLLNDVTSGSNGSCSVSYLCTAGSGYDGPTGLGTPNGLGAFTALNLRISGTVTRAGGTPLAGIVVRAASAGHSTSATTGADGTYSLGVIAGSYTVSFTDPAWQYATGYYASGGFTANPAAATPVSVDTSSVSGIDVQLPVNPAIRGTVRGVQGEGLSGIQVTATAGSVAAHATTGQDGTYAVIVPAGSYTVGFVDPTGAHRAGYYASTGYTQNPGAATPVVVGSADVPGINVTLPVTVLQTRSFLTMTSQPGDYIGGGRTYDYSPATGTFSGSYGGTTASFAAITPGYAHWWYVQLAAPAGQPLTPGVYSGAQRASFRDAGRPGMDIYGDGRGCNTLTGTFTVLTAVYGPGNAILRFDATFEQHCEGAAAALIGQISYIAPASLTVSPASATVAPGISQAYTARGVDAQGRDIGDVTAAATFSLAGGTCTGATCTSTTLGDHTLTAAYGGATGTATLRVEPHGLGGTVSDGVSGLEGIDVLVESTDGATFDEVQTDALGSWFVDEPPGQYTISFVDYSDTYASGYLGSNGFTYDASAAMPVALGPTSVTGLDVVLPRALHISGSVTDTQGSGLGDVAVLASSADDLMLGDWTITDDAGRYSLTISPGSYLIQVWDLTGAHPMGYWSAAGFTDDRASAGSVAVTTADRPGIDVMLPTGFLVSGHVSDSTGAALGDIEVDVLTPTGHVAGSTGTDDRGDFSILVAPGGHLVSVFDLSGRYASGYWSGTGFTADKAQAATVSSATSGVNLSLPLSLSAPRDVVAVARDGSATVSWSPPLNDGGSPVTGYVVMSTTGGKICMASGRSCTVHNLTNGASYRFTVFATNVGGRGPDSQLSNSVIAGSPGRATNIQATRGDRAVTVSWADAPANASPITGYTVTSSPDGRTCTAAGTLTCEVGGLANGQAYTFTVVATNAYGTGVASDPSAPVIPAGPPGKPTSVQATGGDGSATVSWAAAPANGSPITGYAVTSAPDGKSCTTAGALTCPVAGLTNGQSYSFTVTATNVVGTSEPSAASGLVTPSTTPDAPAGVTGLPGNGTVLVGWVRPAWDGGGSITQYIVTSSPDGRSCTLAPPFATTLECLVSGLTNGQPYTFQVTAANGAGLSLPSTPSAAVVPATGRLTTGFATTSVGTAASSRLPVTVTWSSSLPSPTVERWTLQRRLGTGGTWTGLSLSQPTLTTFGTSLVPGTRATFRVRPTTTGDATGPWFTGVPVTPRSIQNTATGTIHYAGTGWTTSWTSTAYGGSVRYATRAGRTATATLSGSSLALVSTRGRGMGKAEVWLDGKRVAVLDLYASSTKPRQIVWAVRFSAPGSHRLVLKVLGTRNPAATGSRVDLDGVLVLQ